MPVEVERKFLVPGAWPRPAAGQWVRQGYLSTEDAVTVRVRRVGRRGFLTVKGGAAGVVRDEFEYEIPVDHADEMLSRLCRPLPIEKTRFAVVHAGHLWEVDLFEGDNAGLVLAEVELARPDEPLDLPPWVGREVTDDIRYRNAYLARHPYRTWPEGTQ